MSLTPRIDRLDKNYLINGAFDYYQRGGALSSVNTSTSSTYSGPDRWRFLHAGTFTGTPNIARSTLVPNSKTQYSNNWVFRRNAGTATLTLEQRIESRNCYELFEAGKMSLSFYINSSIAPVGSQVSIFLSSANAVDDFSAQTQQYTDVETITTASTWQLLKFEDISTFSPMTNGMSVRIEISYPSGTDGSNQSVLVSQIMLNAGTQASIFSRFARTLTEELAVCQRYYEKTFNIDTTPIQASGEGGHISCMIFTVNANATIAHWTYKTRKRVSAPTFTTYNPYVSGSGFARSGSTNVAAEVILFAENSAAIRNTGTFSATEGSAQIHVTADAEL